MRILGIETSCDETAVSLIEASGTFGADFKFAVLGNALLSQAPLHAEYGGVFPNLAKREHAKNLVPILLETLTQAGALQDGATSYDEPALRELLAREPELFEQISAYFGRYRKPDVDCIAVTAGPGLEPALWVGINFAKALSAAWGVPLVAVNHMEGHVVMPLIEHSHIPKYVGMSGAMREFDFPLLALLISGGHTELVLSKDFGHYERIGETRDDAAGEAFDKVARLLELGYPGGPEISRLAAEARRGGVTADFSFTRPMLKEDNFDFSFSGLKTAVRRVVEERGLAETLKLQVAREFEECVADVLVGKTLRAADEYGAQTLVLGGGVSANTYIKECFATRIKDGGSFAQLLVPEASLATDNALMIALAGYFHAERGSFDEPADIRANGLLALGA